MLIHQLSRMMQTVNRQGKFPTLAVNATVTPDTDMFRPLGINQCLVKMVIVHLQFLLRAETRIIIRARTSQQHRLLLQIEHHIRFQLQTAGEIPSGREIQLAAPRCMQLIDGCLQAVCIQCFSIAHHSVTKHIIFNCRGCVHPQAQAT